MKHLHLVRLLALSIPFATALPVVHAAPRNGVPANGYRRNQSQVVRDNVVRGVVSRTYNSHEFDVEAQGRIVRVKSDAFQNLRPGDYVVARGDLRGNTFYAEFINRQDDNVRGNQGREQRINFSGEVVEVENANQMRVRADDGRVFSVRTVGTLSRGISRGDEVRVSGTFDGSFVRANNEDVDLLRNDNTYNNGGSYSGNGGYYGNAPIGGIYGNGGNYNGSYPNNGGNYNGGYPNNGGNYGNGGNNSSQRVNFRARVTRVLRRGELEVRGDNGQIYVVREPKALVGYTRVGDRVQIQGTSRAGFIAATNIDRVR